MRWAVAAFDLVATALFGWWCYRTGRADERRKEREKVDEA